MEQILGIIAYDTTLYRPGCALIQAALGGSSELAQEFPTDLWLLVPTPNMKVYPVRDRKFLDMLIDTSRHYNPIQGYHE